MKLPLPASITILAILIPAPHGLADELPNTLEEARTRSMLPYTGPTTRGVDTSTLTHKVVCGYQGWFNTPADGAGRGWVHWTKHRGDMADGNAKVDLWPDMSEFSQTERFATGFKLPDGKPAEVFSSFNRDTVMRHFQWMREYGVDAAFVQRFAGGLRDPKNVYHNDMVLAHCREGANLNGRAYVVMYDLSGLGVNRMNEVMDDWRALRTRMKIADDPSYLHHRGQPLVVVWGIGFNDGRAYTLEECGKLIDFLKDDPKAGGCSVMLGVPTYWRDLKRDTIADPRLLELLAKVDVISPWTVGRYRNPEEARGHIQRQYPADIAWCSERKIDYLPVIFPGFSWANMRGTPKDSIPRLGGQFFWTQFCQAKKAGASMLYIAMFDEVDEGTAIFKCTNDVPVGNESKFVTLEGKPSDYYLRLAGRGAKVLRGELPPDETVPDVSHNP